MTETTNNRKRTALRVTLWVLLTPVALLILLMVLLYVPPVQDFIRREATTLASEATGMEIDVERIDLRFPLNLLVRGVQVVQPADSMATDVQAPDTLLRLDRLNVSVQAMPLLRGQVEVDGITLEGVAVNSARLLPGMQVQGTLGRFFLKSHGVDLVHETVTLNSVELADTHVQVQLTDTLPPEPEDTTATAPLNWKIQLHELKLADISVGLDMPLDSLRLDARVGSIGISEAEADLGRQAYGFGQFLLEGTTLDYRTGAADTADAPGFNPAHIALRDVRLGIDSVHYCGHDIRARIRELVMNERSGLSITSLTGEVQADSTVVRIPSLRLLTPNSEIDLSAQTYWQLIDIPTTGHLSARLNARIGKQDVMLLAGNLPESFKENYPMHPLRVRAGTEGNLKQMQISRFNIDLPGAFALDGGGEFWNLNDSIRRNGSMDLRMRTGNLEFLTGLAGDSVAFAVPDSMRLDAKVGMEGNRVTASLQLQEQQGFLGLNADYNLADETYHADLGIDSLQINHFLPNDSIYLLSARLTAQGKGTDIASPSTRAALEMSLGQLQYGHWDLNGIGVKAGLEASVASVSLSSRNDLLQMTGKADLRLDRTYLDGTLDVDVDNADLHSLGIAPQPLKRPFAFRLGAEARHDSVKIGLTAGDMDFRFRARSTLKRLMEQGTLFADLLMKQIDNRKLDHAELRRALPSAGMQLKAGRENPLGYLLNARGIGYHDFTLMFGFTPDRGINGRTAIHGLRADSLQLDTVYFAISQDTTRMKLQGGVINGPKNPQFTFHSRLTGEIRNEDAELTVGFTDGQGKTGILLGLNARPLTEGNGKGNGMLLHLTPEEPIVAYRKFRFKDAHNWVYLHKNMRVYANIDMQGDDGIGFRMQSDTQDTVSLQNIHLELNRFRLSELSQVLPYLPKLRGLLSANANYVQTTSNLRVSAGADIQELSYEGKTVGDIGLEGTWLPDEGNRHLLGGKFKVNGQEVLAVGGIMGEKNGRDTLAVAARMKRFPLAVANAFVPDDMITLRGYLNSEISLRGSLDKPELQGQLSLDTTSVYIRQAGARYWFDTRPVKIEDNQLVFDRFSIYTTSDNPFTINGKVDFRNLERPTADLQLKAVNYNLLNAPRHRGSLVYGKVYVDLLAMVRGPLDALTMRGNMNLLGNTNVTYVLTDSPLTVEDRLDELVTFTSFNDTTTVQPVEGGALSLGGMDVLLSLHIDDAVRLRADLVTDGSKYIELEGGGDLSLQYTPQGDMSLTGRYTLSGGMMKYSLPIIPLKEFKFDSGSYVDWRGDLMDPTLSLKATERVRASVSDGGEDGASRMVNFDVSIAIKNRLSAPDLVFDITAPEDATVENELQAMGAEERSKQAIAMMATGIYMGSGGGGGNLSMGAALNSVLQNQINSLAGSMKGASISVGVEDRTSAETGDKQTDYSFRYSQRFFNDRIQVVIGGKVTTGANATNNAQSFIDNISLEYRLDNSGTRYVRVFYNKNYESVLDGEITETGLGLVLRRKMDRLGELFIFRKRQREEDTVQEKGDE